MPQSAQEALIPNQSDSDTSVSGVSFFDSLPCDELVDSRQEESRKAAAKRKDSTDLAAQSERLSVQRAKEEA